MEQKATSGRRGAAAKGDRIGHLLLPDDLAGAAVECGQNAIALHARHAGQGEEVRILTAPYPVPARHAADVEQSGLGVVGHRREPGRGRKDQVRLIEIDRVPVAARP